MVVKKGSSVLLKDVAYEKIKENILEEVFETGSFLSERELIDFLGMSKTPIKSALVRLETEGFVTVSSKQGIIINDISIDRIIDIYNLRMALESFVCEQITGKITSEQMKKIEENLQETKEGVDKLDVKGFTELDHAFHLLLCEISENKEIFKVLLNYQYHLRRITLKHLRKDPQRMRRFYAEHLEIVEELKKGSIESASLMKAHLQNSKEGIFN